MWTTALGIFATVFVAEMGDKTQLATLLYATDRQAGPWMVFASASIALIAATAIGVLVGGQLERFVSPATLKVVAGIGFIAIGLWTLLAR
jgi:putative Ca2+/H+ antiporter (TMEM165/GDT1 family)